MTSRNDILAELGLSPLWLDRSRLEQTQTVATPTAHDLEATPKGDPGDRAPKRSGQTAPDELAPKRSDRTAPDELAPKRSGQTAPDELAPKRSGQTAPDELASQPNSASSPEKIPLQRGQTDDLPVGQMDWLQLRQAVAGCTACALHAKRRQAVFGVGDERADWLIVGEGPGAEEDARGEPFVGQAGKLLDNMLSAIGLARGNNVYIANVVKCRPPGNRTPSLEEAEACAAFLDRQIELIQPRLVVALGKVAARRMLGRDATLASLRKTIHDYRGIPLVVTYHPAYLLRNLPDKAKAWEDLCFAVDTMSGLADAQDGRK